MTMKVKRGKVYNDNVDPPRWEYSVHDGVTGTGVWTTAELEKSIEKLTYTKLKELLDEENALSDKH